VCVGPLASDDASMMGLWAAHSLGPTSEQARGQLSGWQQQTQTQNDSNGGGRRTRMMRELWMLRTRSSR